MKYHIDGVEKRVSLGVYPEITLKRARERCLEARRLIAEGIDPSAQCAIATGRAERDVTADLRDALAPVRVTHHAAIIEPEKIGELLRAIDNYRGHPVTEAALKLAPLLFVRPGELRLAEWADIRL
ncbi:MAG: integrase family protein [Gammaproteobacteria bacterium]